jgi:hypothetical protein
VAIEHHARLLRSDRELVRFDLRSVARGQRFAEVDGAVLGVEREGLDVVGRGGFFGVPSSEHLHDKGPVIGVVLEFVSLAGPGFSGEPGPWVAPAVVNPSTLE